MMNEDGLVYVRYLHTSQASQLILMIHPPWQFPKLLRNEMSVHIIQSRDHIL